MNNFLSIVWYRVLPPDYGGQKGIAHFNYHLGKRVPLTCLCSANTADDGKLSYELVNELPLSKYQFWNPLVRRRILSFIRKRKFTHIIIEHPWHGWLGNYKKKYGFRFILHAHNVEHLRIKEKHKLWWRLLKKTEQQAFKSADHVLFKTAGDIATAINLFDIPAEKCLIVPYGITETAQPVPDAVLKGQLRTKYKIAPDEKMVLFAGSLDYQPNAEALAVLTDHVLRLLRKQEFRFRLIICGNLPNKRLRDLNSVSGVTATGFVPSIRDYLQSADVFVNPVTHGSGIQTKNIDAIAQGCNVVCTGFAATGLPGYVVNKKVFTSPDNDWKEFAENIVIASSRQNDVPLQFYIDYNWQNIIDHLLAQVVSPEQDKS